MLLLLALLQLAPPAATVLLAEGQPAPRSGLLVDPLRLDRIGRELDACEIERDGAREAARLLRGIPAQLEVRFDATLARVQTIVERERAVTLARLVKAVRPAPTPWYRSPWLWGAVGLSVGAGVAWGLR